MAADPVPAATRKGFLTGVAATLVSPFPFCAAAAAAAPDSYTPTIALPLAAVFRAGRAGATLEAGAADESPPFLSSFCVYAWNVCASVVSLL